MGKSQNGQLALNRLYEHYREDPVFFVEHCLGISTWSKMRDILISVRDNKRTAVRASHGVSKTFTAAAIATWFFNVFPDSKVITTAPTWTQVANLLWSEIGRLYRTSRMTLDGKCLSISVKSDKSEHFAIGFSTDKPAKAEGYHAPSILFIFDEAKGIHQWMWDAVKGAMTGGRSRILVISTTDGVQIGENFYNVFKKDQKNLWNKIHIDCKDSPYFTDEPFKTIKWKNKDPFKFERVEIPSKEMKDKIQIATPEWEKDCIDDWGEDSILYLTKARGAIAEDTVDTICHLPDIYRMFENYEKPVEIVGEEEVGVDVARFGSDSTFFYKKKGLCVTGKMELTKADTVKIANELEIFVDYNKDIIIKIDDTGVGGGVTDNMIAREYKNIVPVNFNQVAMDQDRYPSAISEMWFETAKILKDIRCPKSERLQTELANRKRALIDKKGRRVVESKGEYKKRGFRSPDEADCFLLCFYRLRKIDLSVINADYI